MRRATKASWPFTYETDASVIVETVARYEDSLRIERAALARSLRRGNPRGAIAIHRHNIDRLEAARRAGLTRLRSLAAAREGAAPHPAVASFGRAA